MIDRRSLVAAALAGLAGAPLSARRAGADAAARFAAIEAANGGRLGVHAIDTGSGATIGHRARERFAMCSTHKVQTAAAVLAAVEAGRLRLDQPVRYGTADLLEYAPVTRRHVAEGSMTVEALCAAAVRWSDNSADNLLLRLIGGPAGWTRYVRSIGDATARLDRTETALNSAIPGDPRDTITPRAMTADLRALLLGSALGTASRARLAGWMTDSPVTVALLRAGLPPGWRVADKSGSGENGSRNDVGILYPPGAAPIVVAAFYTGSDRPMAVREQVIAQVATLVAAALRAG